LVSQVRNYGGWWYVAKGGHARSGPPPDPNALRRSRSDDAEWTTLPAEGRTDPAPAWPLSRATPAERKLWVRLWTLPQAIEWERRQQDDEVALYCRRFIEAQKPGSAVNLSTLVRQMRDSLGLTTPGMRSNRWLIGAPATAARRQAPKSSSKSRLRVVAADALEGTDAAG
jgi:hypothetical protein